MNPSFSARQILISPHAKALLSRKLFMARLRIWTYLTGEQ
jgi:hypothetical protein